MGRVETFERFQATGEQYWFCGPPWEGRVWYVVGYGEPIAGDGRSPRAKKSQDWSFLGSSFFIIGKKESYPCFQKQSDHPAMLVGKTFLILEGFLEIKGTSHDTFDVCVGSLLERLGTTPAVVHFISIKLNHNVYI